MIKMKKLGKLFINPEKVIKNEDLVNLKGGDYGSGTSWIYCKSPETGATCYSFEYIGCGDPYKDWIAAICQNEPSCGPDCHAWSCT